MQFQVPQFIESEDKIVGPLSLKQFAYFGVGGLISALFYFTVQTWLWAIVSIFIFGIAFALSFIKIQGRSFASVMISAFYFYWKPQTYVWQPEHPTITKPKRVAAEEDSSALSEILSESTKKMTRIVTATTPGTSQKIQSPLIHAKSDADEKPTATAPYVSASQKIAAAGPAKMSDEDRKPISRETAKIGSALHRAWEGIQTGTPLSKKTSDKEFLERKMAERYQIFQRISGDRGAAKRVDYR